MQLNREKIQRMFTGSQANGGGGGGGDTEGLASELWVEQNYLSKEFFLRLFNIHGEDENDDPVDVQPNDLETTITDIEAMFGFWTEQYLSALGQNSEQGGGGITLNAALASINNSPLGNPTGTSTVLMFNGTTWVYATMGSTDMNTVWTALADGTDTHQINVSHLTTALSGYATTSQLSDYATVTDLEQLASYFNTLSGYFTNGAANEAVKLETARTIWGQQFDGTANITGDISQATCLEFSGIAGTATNGGFIDFHYAGGGADYTSRIIEDVSGVLKINNTIWAQLSGNVSIGTSTISQTYKLDVAGYTKTTRLYLADGVYLEYDSTNSGVHLVGAGFYSDSYVSALGVNSGGGGGSDYIPLTGSDQIAGSLIPVTTNAHDLGDSTHAWRNIRGNSIYASNSITTYYLTANSTVTAVGSITSSAGNIIASAGYVSAAGGFKVTGKDDTYVLLAGGGTALLSTVTGDYLPLTGGTLTGNIYVSMSSTSNAVVSASNTNGSIELLSSSSRGVYDRTNGVWLVATNGTNTFLSLGNVGIGTASPSYKLEVNGAVLANGFKMPNKDYTDVLLADGTTTKLKTINNISIFGSGNIDVSGGGSSGNTFTDAIFVSTTSNVDNGMETNNGTRHALFGTGTSGNTGIYVYGIGWIVGANSSGSVYLNGNASTATKLNNAVSLWGNSFDGSSNITGRIYANNGITVENGNYGEQLIIKRTSANDAVISYYNNNGFLGYIGISSQSNVYWTNDYSGLNLYYFWSTNNSGTTSYDWSCKNLIAGTKAVVGSSSVSSDYTLYVNGNGGFENSLTVHASTGGAPYILLQRGTSSDDYWDWKIKDESGVLYFDLINPTSTTTYASFSNNGIYLKGALSGVTNVDSLLYFDTTNTRVGIDKSSPAYTLDVNGSLYAASNSVFGGTLSVENTITLTGGTAAKQRIYFDSTHYVELDSSGYFHFSHGVYSDGFMSALGLNSGGGGAADYIPLSGSTNITGDLTPSNNNSVSLGSSSKLWAGVYCINLRAYGASSIAGNLSLAGSITPTTDQQYSLGTESLRFAGLFVHGRIYLSGMNIQYLSSGSGVLGGYHFQAGSSDIILETSGYVWQRTTSQYYSDIRRKNIVSYIDTPVDKIANAPIFTFTWKDFTCNMQQGSSAQYWRDVLPNGVAEASNGTLGMDYATTALISAVITARKVVDHEARIRLLEVENAALRNEINQLKKVA